MNDRVTFLLNRLEIENPVLIDCMVTIRRAYNLLSDCFTTGHKLLVCGNGGSAADSEHIVGELMKGFLLKRPVSAELRARLVAAYPDEGEYLADNLQQALPAISLNGHASLTSAFINDVRPDMVYAQQVLGYGVPGDVLLAISTSGNSANIVNAVRTAKVKGLKTIGMTGETGGKLKELADVMICVPAQETYRVQELHLPVYHALCAMLEARFYD